MTGLIIGENHNFGFNREGNSQFLNANKQEYLFNLHVLEPILYLDIPISSSRIRSFIKDGNIDEANKCLGWSYQISGTIVKGYGLGTKLEFPTANIQPNIPHQLIPRKGVYCVDAIIEESYYRGMCNIGQRPTFHKNGDEVIEVHLFSNNELNIYEKKMNCPRRKRNFPNQSKNTKLKWSKDPKLLWLQLQ